MKTRSINNFDFDELRRWYSFNYACFLCGKNGQDAFHHILGRSSNSILNACVLHNEKCHLYNSDLFRKETRIKLLKKVFIFLIKSGYELNKKDIEFIEKNQEYYNEIFKEIKNEKYGY